MAFLHPDTPKLQSDDFLEPTKITALVDWYSTNYPLSIHTLLANGITGHGHLPQHPRSHPFKEGGMLDWLLLALILDLSSCYPPDPVSMERLLDELDLASSQALLKLGSVAIKYDLFPNDYTVEGLSRINEGADQTCFLKNLITEALLDSEFQVVSTIFFQKFARLYQVKT